MFDNVVVGVADDRSGRDALELARRLGSGDGSLTLVHVQVLVLAPPDSEPSRQAERERVLRWLASFRDAVRVDAQLLSLEARSVAVGLHETARGRADLLVIGTSRSDDYERVFVGDDTRAVLQDPPSAVAVAPAGYALRAGAVKRIGVAYDGSPSSGEALAVARRLARERHAQLSAFQAVPERLRVRDPWNPEREIQEGVARAHERLAALGGVEPHAASGDAADELARYSASVDLLVLGSHQHRPIDAVLGGGTSQRLVATVACPLLALASARSTTCARLP